MPCAPWIVTSSSSGELIACCAACQRPALVVADAHAHQGPPWPDMIVRTSAKSTLMMPGTVIRSDTPLRRVLQHLVRQAERVEQAGVRRGPAAVDRSGS
jgi:hypothetical protein